MADGKITKEEFIARAKAEYQLEHGGFSAAPQGVVRFIQMFWFCYRILSTLKKEAGIDEK